VMEEAVLKTEESLDDILMMMIVRMNQKIIRNQKVFSFLYSSKDPRTPMESYLKTP